MELLGESRPDMLVDLQSKELERFKKKMKTYPSVLRTQYAYALLAEGDS